MKFRDLHTNIKLRLIEQGLNNLVANAVYPFMVIYFSERFGAALTGLLLMIRVGAQVLSGFYGGSISDKFGRRYVMLRAEWVRLFSHVILALASSPWWDSAYVVFFMMVLAGICSGISAPAGKAMLIDVSTPENRRMMYSFNYWSTNASLMLGTMLGGLFFNKHRFIMLSLLTLSSLISLVILLFFIKETKFREKNVNSRNIVGEIIRDYKNVIQDRAFKPYFLASIIDLSIELQARNYLPIFYTEHIFDKKIKIFNKIITLDGYETFSIIYIVNTLIVITISTLISRLAKKWSEKSVLYGGLLLYSLGYGILANSTIIWLLVLVMAIVTLGEIAYVPVKETLLANFAPENNRGAYMAVNGLGVRISTMAASLFVTIGALTPPWIIGGLFWFMGISSIYFYNISYKNYQRSKINIPAVGKK